MKDQQNYVNVEIALISLFNSIGLLPNVDGRVTSMQELVKLDVSRLPSLEETLWLESVAWKEAQRFRTFVASQQLSQSRDPLMPLHVTVRPSCSSGPRLEETCCTSLNSCSARLNLVTTWLFNICCSQPFISTVYDDPIVDCVSWFVCKQLVMLTSWWRIRSPINRTPTIKLPSNTAILGDYLGIWN